MKATRVLGFWAGVLALVALFVLAIGTFLAMRLQLQDFLSFGIYPLGAGVLFLILSVVAGVAHLILRIWHRDPYRNPRGARKSLAAGRIMVWIWAFSLIGIAVGSAIWLLGPGKDYLSLLQLL